MTNVNNNDGRIPSRGPQKTIPGQQQSSEHERGE
jgi:hypothetical protein